MSEIATISRDAARRQFDELTEKLGLIHTFTFDEMYEWLMELRRRQAQPEFRAKIVEFEKIIKATPGTYGEDPFPLVHTFINGLYVRQVTVPARILTVTKIHAVEHVFFLQKGTVSILTESGIISHTAPYQGVTKVGTKRIIYHHDEVIFTTVHPTNKTTVAEVEAEIFAQDFEALNCSTPEEERLPEFIDTVFKEA